MASPARQQYLEIKRRHPDAILMFRLGDFYEMFDEDAVRAAGILGIQLTARNYPRGEGKVPMAGVPFHSVHGYLKRLLDAGERVAVCEQLTPPGEGIVERGVVRVFTPGTLVEPDMLRAEENNYLATVASVKDAYGLAYVDITTGEFVVSEMDTIAAVDAELLRISPAECLVSSDSDFEGLGFASRKVPFPTSLDPRRASRMLTDHFGTPSLAGFGIERIGPSVVAAAAILDYLAATNREALGLIRSLRTHTPGSYLVLDRYTRASLEIAPKPGGGSKKWTLLRVLDQTKTGMGARKLRMWLSQPLLDCSSIDKRLDSVQALVQQPTLVKRLVSQLGDVGDVERITGRIIQGRWSVQDLIQLRLSLETAVDIRDSVDSTEIPALSGPIDPCSEVSSAIERAVDPTGKPSIKVGFSEELDRYRLLAQDSRSAVAALERKEVQATGVKTIRVGYNKVFGYYFEVGKAAAASVPERFIRQQTLVNAERFTTPELKELEVEIADADEKAQKLESELLQSVVDKVRASQATIMSTADVLATLDVFCALAGIAVGKRYCRPTITESTNLSITAARHPVVEVADPENAFVPNDCIFDETNRIIILTGPNMGGKSTMLRTVALIVLMAQIGSFVPAEHADIGIVDRIFSRVGAQDDISSGQSTFMTEMIETANILHNATSHSLLILDEIGRGTSTYDGLAIARAVIEFIHARIRARTLFATHYHELAALEGTLDHVVNFHTEIAEQDGKVIFLHRISRGSADRSYGIHVARLAGLPHSVTVRADRLLRQLEKSSNGAGVDPGPQMTLFTDPDLAPRSEIEEAAVKILDQILALDLESTTPLEAMDRLHRFQQEGRSSR